MSHTKLQGKRNVAVAALAALLLTTAPLAPSTTAHSVPEDYGRTRGPWYTDLGAHWARTYVLTLWRQGVTTAPVKRGRDELAESWSWTGPYSPDTRVSERVFGTTLARVFPGGHFPPPAAVLDLAAGTPPGGGGGGEMSGSVLRQDAVAFLTEALGLGDYARAFDPATAATYLRQFRDGATVAPAYRQTMAVAVFLGIIRGYPDRTIQPRRALTRAEAATIIYRSCLFLADAEPNPFSPDGDGTEDTTTFYLGSLLNLNSRAWDLDILDASGAPLRHLPPPDAGTSPPASLVWDGSTDGGVILAPGTYYYRGWLEDREGVLYWSALKPIILEAKSLQGFARPAVVLPGDEVTLSARATGGPSRVEAVLASFPEAGTIRLAGAAGTSRDWEVRFAVPGGAGPGPCQVTFTARYPSATRTAKATFTVAGLAVTGQLRPNPVAAGRSVSIDAWPNIEPDRCQATLKLGKETRVATLAPAGMVVGRRTWSGTSAVSLVTPPGSYPVTITAVRGGTTATAVLWLTVTQARTGVTFLLSD